MGKPVRLGPGGGSPAWAVTGVGSQQSGLWNAGNAQFAGASGGNLPAPANGAQMVYMLVSAGGVGWTNAVPLGLFQPSTTYTLTIAAGVRLDDATMGDAISEGTISFIANNLNSVPTAISRLSINRNLIPAGTFADFTTSFTTPASGEFVGEAFKVQFGYAAGNASGIVFDNVRVDATAVPEPSAALLSFLSITGMLGCRFRRTRNA